MDIRGVLDRYILRFVAGQPALKSRKDKATFSITQRKLEQKKEQELSWKLQDL
jgi:hypothetical protein